MCGIAGIARFDGQAVDLKHLSGMADALRHRGPNASGIRAIGPNGLAHRRLSIIDLSPSAAQPMTNEDQSVWLTYNGEIYNFVDLKRQLERKGHRFATRTDSEVLVHGYEEWGVDLLDRLNGIFAFAIYDAGRNSWLIARDRLGIKPLYYALGNWGLAFASEVKALITLPEIHAALNIDALAKYLSYLWVPGPQTAFAGILKVRPGHYLIIEADEVRDQEYWAPVIRSSKLSFAETAEALAESVATATRRQLVSDVPLGFFLSGGLDSSLLLACASPGGAKQTKAFSVGFREEDQSFERPGDDLVFARRVAKRFDADLTETVLHPDIVTLLPRIVYGLEEPLADPAAIPAYLIAEQARRQNVTVLLSGQGADESFAGYPWQLAGHLLARYRRLPGWLRSYAIEAPARHLPAHVPGPFAQVLRRIKRFARDGSRPLVEAYPAFRTYAPAPILAQLLANRDLDEIDAEHRAYLGEREGADPVNQMVRCELQTLLPEQNLLYTDKMSMLHSLEVRVPFLDNEVVDLALQTPGAYKIRGRERKAVLKKAAERYLPNDVIYRKKLGFGVPIRSWITRELQPMVRDHLSPVIVQRRGLFDPKAVSRLIDSHYRGSEDHSLLLYSLLCLELWCRSYLDNFGSGGVSHG